VGPALGEHFDPAVIKPPEDVDLIRHGVVVTRILAAKSVVGDDRGEIVAALTSPTYCWSRHFDFPPNFLRQVAPPSGTGYPALTVPQAKSS